MRGPVKKSSQSSLDPLIEAKTNRAHALRDVTRYILERYHTELGYSGAPEQWVGQLTARSEATGKLEHKLASGVIRQILNGGAVNRTDFTLKKLARILSTKPVPRLGPDGLVQRDLKGHVLNDYETIKGLNGLDAPQLRLPSLEKFKEWEQSIARSADPPASVTFDEPAISYTIIVPNRHHVRLTRDRKEVHYVTWRYAFDNSPFFTQIAREVLTFTHADDGIHYATMSYQIGDNDRHLRLFKGPVIPLGQSRMCVMTSTNKIPGDWAPEDDRGRVLFMRRDPDKGVPVAQFGILASTRVTDGAPCSACLIMLLVDGDIQDIDEYRQRVTIVDSEERILRHDFGSLTDQDVQRVRLFLENVPDPYRKFDQQAGGGGSPFANPEREIYPDDNAEFDMVLRLHVERFKKRMTEIRNRILENRIKNPIAKRWDARGVLLARGHH
jgi:hypothetical protein